MLRLEPKKALLFVSAVLAVIAGTAIAQQAAQQARNAGLHRWSAGPTMNTARTGSCSAMLADGRVLVTGGADGSGTLNSAEVLSLDGKFVNASPMMNGRTDHFCAALPDGTVLVAGGRAAGGPSNAAELYAPDTDEWTSISPLTVARAGATAVSLKDGRIVIAGGNVSGAVSNTIEIFDPATHRFTRSRATLSASRQGHAASLLRDGRVLIAGGSDGSVALDSVDMYDPSTDSVSPAFHLSTPRVGLSATTLLDGNVLFAGGNDGAKDLNTAEVFNSKAGTLGDVIKMGIARRDHTALSLPKNNTVLFVGGTSSDVALVQSEVYVPWRNQFEDAGALSLGRVGANLTAVPASNTLLVMGGRNSAMAVTGRTEAQAYATLTSDKTDYMPGETVILTGTGWQPNETVQIVLHVNPTTHPDVTINATADPHGNFTDSSYVVKPSDLGVTFYVTATGLKSGKTAAVLTFKDGGVSITAAGSITVTGSPALVVVGTGAPSTCTATSTSCDSSITQSQTQALTASAGSTWTLPSNVSVFSGCTPGNVNCSVTRTNSGSGTIAITNATTLSSATLNGAASAVYTGSTGYTLVGTGTNYVNGATILYVDGVAQTTTCSSSTTCTASVGRLNVGTHTVTVNGTGSATVTVTARPLTVTATTNTKTYDGTTTAAATPSVTSGTVQSGDTANFTEVYSTAAAGSGTKTLVASGNVSDGNTGLNYACTFNSFTTGTINTATLTMTGVTASNKVYDRTTTATLTGTPALVGVISPDSVSVSGTGVGTFASSGVANGIAVTVTGYTLSGGQAGNYTLTQPTGLTANITKAPLTVTGLSASSRTYNQTTTATITGTGVLSGLISSDTATLSGTPTGTFASANVGNGISVTVSGLSISGGQSANYALTQPTLSANITALTLTVTGLTANNKVYDRTTSATTSGTAALSGVLGGDTVTLGGTPSATFASANVGTGIAVSVSGYTISGGQAGNYTLTQPTTGLSANITAVGLTVTGLTANNKVYDRTTAATTSGTAALSGVLGSDTVTLTGTPVATFADANVANGIVVSVAGYTLGGGQAGNYTLTQPSLSANITAKALTVTGLTASNKVYDGTTAATLTGTAALSGVIASDVVNLSGSPAGTFASANVANGIGVSVTGYSLTGAQASNYSLTQPTLSANITPATVTVTGLSANNKVYDRTAAASLSGTAALSGVFSPDVVTLSGSPVATFTSVNVANGIAVTVTGYSLSGTPASNYTLTQPAGLTANITAKALTITGLTAANKPYDGTTAATLNGTASLVGVISPDAVSLGGSPLATFASATVSNGISVTVTGYTLSGAQAGNYSLTQPAGLTANITAIPLTITGLTASNKVYDRTTTASVSGTAGLSGVNSPDVVNLVGSPVAVFASANVGNGISVSVTGYTLGGAQAGNYTLTPLSLSANITPVTVTVSGLTANNKAYDGNTSATVSGTPGLNGVLSPDVVSVTGTGVASFASSSVANGIAVSVTGYSLTGAQAGNYSLTQPTTGLSANITAKSLTITGITASNKVYDGTTNASFTGTPAVSGLAGSDSVTIGGSPVAIFASANVGNGIGVSVSGFTISGGQSANYTLTQPTTGLSANITAVSVTASVTASDKLFDGNANATITGCTPVGVLPGDVASVGCTAAGPNTFSDATAAPNKTVTATNISLTGGKAGNYSLTSTSATTTASITGGAATVTLINNSYIYNGLAHSVGFITNPANLSVSATGTGASPQSAVGVYPVTGTISDPSYSGSTSGYLFINSTLTASPRSGQVTLSWRAYPGAVSYSAYAVQSATQPTLGQMLAGTALPVLNTTAQATNLTNGTLYWFVVVPNFGSGPIVGAVTPTISATPKSLTP